MDEDVVGTVARSLSRGKCIPYLGPGVLTLDGNVPAFPATPEELAKFLSSHAGVPHKIRGNLTATAQFIENFKHRKSLVALMSQAFQPVSEPNSLHLLLANSSPGPRLIVDTWYDGTMASALGNDRRWGQVQGISQSEHYGEWVHYYGSDGAAVSPEAAESWDTLLYKPLGCIAPAKNFILSDSDFVEVLTEIDIQTPIPPLVRQVRTDSAFLFLGCRFSNQLTRAYARQIMKRSSDLHWAVMEGPLTRMEQKFVAEQNITVIDLPLQAFLSRIGTP